MRIEQYFLMNNYLMREVILNGDSPVPTRVVDVVPQPVAPTTTEQRLTRKNELKARGTLRMALPDKHQLKFNSHKDAKTLMEAIVKSLPSEWRTHTLIWRNKTDLEEQSLDDLFNSLKIYEAEAKRRNLRANGPTSVGFDMSKVECYNCHRKGHFARECRSPKDSRRNGAAEPQRRIVPEEPANYALMAFLSLSSSFDNELRDNALVSLRKTLEKVEQERDDLKLKYQSSNGYHVVPPPYTETFMLPKPDLVFNNAPTAVETDQPAFPVKLSPTKRDQDLSLTNRPSAPIIEDWVSDFEDESKTKAPQKVLSFVQSTRQVKSPRPSVQHVMISIPAANLKPASPKPTGIGNAGIEKQALCAKGNPQHALKNKGVIDSGCSRHMTGNMSYLSDFENTMVDMLPLEVTQRVMCDRKNSVLFTDTKCLVLSPDFKLPDESQVILRVPRENNMYNAEAVNTACYVQNKVLLTKPHNKTPYELLHGRTPSIGFLRPFGCLVTILNTLDSLGKFNGKVDEGFLVGYSVSSKAFRVFNSRTRIVQETLHVNFLENKPIVAGSGPTWLFDIDSLTKTMNYQPVTAGNKSNPSAGFQDKFDAKKAGEESDQQYVLFLVWYFGSTSPQNTDGDAAFNEKEPEFDEKKPESKVNVSPCSSAQSKKQNDKTKREAKGKIPVNATGTLVPAVGQIFPNNTNTFSAAELEDITYFDDEDDIGVEADFNNLEISIIVSPIPTTRVHKDHPVTQIIGDLSSATQTRNMKKVAKDQGGISQMFNDDFHTWFEDPDHPDKVYKVVKALYGLHQAPRAWYETLINYLLENGFQRGKIDQTLFIKRSKGDILLFQVYVDHIIFSSTNKDLCKAFEKLMKDKFQMSSMGELIFFLGLQDPDGEDVDVHTYRSMIDSLMYLPSSRLDIMFADSPFDLVAYSDSDYAAASLDRKSTTVRCQFFGCRLISWQCKKQIVVATSSTEAKYVAAARVDTPRCDEDRLELMELTIFLLPKVEKVRIGVSAVDLQVSAVRLMLLLLVQKFPLFGLTNWCCSLSAVRSSKATIREALRLDDAEGVECLPNEEIFTELARMGYEKPSTKLTFYKAFFSIQWKFLIHTILQCMSAKRTSWNEFSSSMASAIICLSTSRKFNFSKYIFDSLVRNVDSPSKFYIYPCFLQLIIRKQVGNLSTHTTKYTSSALTQKVFANIRRVGKGFSRVETPLFEGMLVAQEVEEGDADENVENVNAGDVAKGDVSTAHGEVPTVAEEPSILSPTPPTPQSQPSQDIPSTSQERMITEIEQDADVVLEDDKEVVDDVKDVQDDIDESAQDQGRKAKYQAEIYKIDLEHANKVLSIQENEVQIEPTKVQEVVDVVTTAKIITEVVTAISETITAASTTITTAEAQVPAATLTAAPARVTAAPSRRRKGVVIRHPREESTTSTIIPAKTKSKDKGKRIMVEEPKPLKKQAQIEQDKKYARELEAELNRIIDWDAVIDRVKIKAKEDPAVKRYQALKRKPQTEAQARKNMMLYLKNVDGFKMDYFKGMSYDDIRSIFEAKFNSKMAFLQKIKEQIEEEESRALKRLNETLAEKASKRQKLDEEVEELKRHLQIVPNEDDDVYTEAIPLARKVHVVDYEIIEQNNKPYYKIIRADDHYIYNHTADFVSGEEVPTHKDYKMDRLARFYLNEIVGRHSVPISIISDRNSWFTSSVRCAPFEALYGKKCRSLIMWVQVEEGQLIGSELVQETTDKISQIKDRLKAGMVRFGKKEKLAPRFIGPFEIAERIGLVAYRLRLPEELNGVHDTFHVSNLKKCLTDPTLQVPLDEI
nr:hypothetical protein [Tanacetum cinerariifolium]